MEGPDDLPHLVLALADLVDRRVISRKAACRRVLKSWKAFSGRAAGPLLPELTRLAAERGLFQTWTRAVDRFLRVVPRDAVREVWAVCSEGLICDAVGSAPAGTLQNRCLGEALATLTRLRKAGLAEEADAALACLVQHGLAGRLPLDELAVALDEAGPWVCEGVASGIVRAGTTGQTRLPHLVVEFLALRGGAWELFARSLGMVAGNLAAADLRRLKREVDALIQARVLPDPARKRWQVWVAHAESHAPQPWWAKAYRAAQARAAALLKTVRNRSRPGTARKGARERGPRGERRQR